MVRFGLRMRTAIIQLRQPRAHFVAQQTRLASKETGPSTRTSRGKGSLPSRAYNWILQRQSVNAVIGLGPLRYIYWVLGIFLAWHIESAYFFTFYGTWGISMLPTLNSNGDWVLISKYYRRGRGLQVGDLVSFTHPADAEVLAVKRVTGLQGDFVSTGPSFVNDDDHEVEVGLGGRMIQVCHLSIMAMLLPYRYYAC